MLTVCSIEIIKKRKKDFNILNIRMIGELLTPPGYVLSFSEKTYTGLVKRHLKEKIKWLEDGRGKQLENFKLETNNNRSSRGEQEGNFLLLITEK